MNKIQIIQSELNKIEARRVNHKITSDRAREAARKIPEFKEIDNELRSIELEIAKHDENDNIVKELRKKTSQLSKKSLSILQKHKIDASSLSPAYDCPRCHDTGYLENGEMCICLKKRVQDALIKQSGINHKLEGSFEKSDKSLLAENPLLNKIYNFAQKYCNNFPNNQKPNLLFFGEVGTGKTYLLECMANALIERMEYVVFTTAYDISNTMIKAFNSPYAERDTILAPLFESDLLIIDDLGTEPLFHESTITNLFTLINERQRNRLPIIISTNLTPDEIDFRYGNRIKSRLFNTRITLCIEFKSKDLRLSY